MQPDPTLTPPAKPRMDELRVAFERQWRAGHPPKIEAYLLQIDDDARPELLRALLAIELDFLRRAGQSPLGGNYVARFPEHDELVREVFGGAATAGAVADKTLDSSDNATETAALELAAGDDDPAPTIPSMLPNAPASDNRIDAPIDTGAKQNVTLESFVRSLTACGLMEQAEIDAFIDQLPDADRAADGKQLARLLCRHKRLTRFQAQAVYQGKTRILVMGNYIVLDRIGKGGMGYVYKARHRRMNRVVALKMLPSDAARSPHSIARFHREMEAAARLSHPNIVTAFDAAEAQGIHFLVMECVDGEDLGVLLKRVGPLPVRTALEYVLQAARGLDYAHSNGVIHRDIKPANLLCDQQGTIKVLDMGLALIQPEFGGDGEHSLTQTGQVMGTLDYMPPEQALDTRVAGARSDIYSLGCTLYYLLTGQCPYGGDTWAKKLLAHRTDPIPEIAARRSGVPASVESAFAAMVAKKPDDRPQTMREVIALLEGCLAPTQLAPTDRGEDMVSPDSHRKRLFRRDRIVIGVAGAVLLTLLGVLGVGRMLRSDPGTVVVQMNEPGATVEVLDEEGEVGRFVPDPPVPATPRDGEGQRQTPPLATAPFDSQEARATVTVRGDMARTGHIMFIFDCSASMNDRRRMEMARQAMREILAQLEEEAGDSYHVGLRAYGHRARYLDARTMEKAYTDPAYQGRVSPDLDVETVVPIGRFDHQRRQAMEQALRQLRPWGHTPLYLALKMSLDERDFQRARPGETKHLVVLTDGVNFQSDLLKKEGLGAEPTTKQDVLETLRAPGNRDVQIDIVALDMLAARKESEQEVIDLEEIAEATGGRYYDAADTRALVQAFREALGLAEYAVFETGQSPPAERK